MAEVNKTNLTPAQERLEQRTLVPEDGSPIDWPYPSPATLVPTDTDFAMESIKEAAAEGHAIVLFYPNGDEVLLTPGRRLPE